MDSNIKALLLQHKQEHLLEHLELLNETERRELLDDIAEINFLQVRQLYDSYRGSSKEQTAAPAVESVKALAFTEDETSRQERSRLHSLGEELLRQGKVACFLVAGGQGTRLGFDGPKGCYPISPIKNKSLFQLFAESVLALQQLYGRPLPWYIMTSRENNGATCSFFEQHNFFGLPRDQVRFIIQQQIPSLDLNGRLIISRDKKIFKNPNGHGGSLSALRESGALDEMARNGVEEIFYFQVDNPLAKIADPLFIGAHADRQADMSSKVVKKTDPNERVGIIGKIDGRLGCIEYSELTAEEAAETTADGGLRFGSANIAIHMLKRGFIEKLTSSAEFQLPYHIALKEIECLDITENQHRSAKIEGIKCELFIFDALGFAQQSATLEIPRAEDFSPVKNSAGSDSPDTARRAMIDLHAGWLKTACAQETIPKNFTIEISPLCALSPEEFTRKATIPSPLPASIYFDASGRQGHE
ncbi:MAG: UDPGP type 1 family protein [Deltaproteobacteria bacterium]|nr:UDPGP type 1 family protein [Deltaproteobacteria bacterium]